MTVPWKLIFETDSEESAAKEVAYLYSLLGSKEVAKACHTTDVTVRNLLKKYNLKRKPHGGQYKGKRVTISQEEYNSMTYLQLSKEKGISVSQVYILTRKLKPKAR